MSQDHRYIHVTYAYKIIHLYMRKHEMLKRALTRTVAWTFSIPGYAQYIYTECDHQLSITYNQMFVFAFLS